LEELGSEEYSNSPKKKFEEEKSANSSRFYGKNIQPNQS
jgi:hypothetical protein